MFHLDNNSGVSAMPPLGAVQSSAPRWFTEGGGGVPASYPGAAWFNMIQAELLNLCAAYGISPDKANLNQLKLAIEAAVNQRAPLASPAFSGVPTAPTASQSTNNTQIATTAFVKAALAALVDSSPAALDTLNELAAALGNDPNFATTMTNALAGKQPLDNTLTALSGKDVAGILSYLGLGTAAQRNVGTGANQLPDMSSFAASDSADRGWNVLPNGHIHQYGIVTLGAVGTYNPQTIGGATYYTRYYVVTLPRAYPTAHQVTTVTIAGRAFNAQGGVYGLWVLCNRNIDSSGPSLTSFTVSVTSIDSGQIPVIHYSSEGY